MDHRCEQQGDEAALHVARAPAGQEAIVFDDCELVGREGRNDVVVAMEVQDRTVRSDRADDDAMFATGRRAVDDLVGDLVRLELGADPLLAVHESGAGRVDGREGNELGRQPDELVPAKLDLPQDLVRA